MNCAYHPDRDPVGAWVSCGRLACAECRVTVANKVYCNPCADALITKPTTSKGSSWFHRHLNWTMVLAWLAAFVAGFMVGVITWTIDPYVSDAQVEVMGALLGAIAASLILGWALRRKNRSLWWLLIGIFVPFGLIVLLCLENRSEPREVREL